MKDSAGLKRIVVVKVDDDEHYAIQFTKKQMEIQPKDVIVTDVRCGDCSGPVTLFLVPDKVWNGIGLTREWICLLCVGRRMNPHLTADELGVTPAELINVIAKIVNKEISRQKRKFKLKNINSYGSAKIDSKRILKALSFRGGSTMTADQVTSVDSADFIEVAKT